MAGIVTGRPGLGNCRPGWARGAISHRESAPGPQAADWQGPLGHGLNTRVLTCIVPNFFAGLRVLATVDLIPQLASLCWCRRFWELAHHAVG